MRKTTFAVTALLAAAAIAWAGGDPWKTKSLDQWTDKDIIGNSDRRHLGRRSDVQPQGAATRPDGMSQIDAAVRASRAVRSDKSHVTPRCSPRPNGRLGKGGCGRGKQASYSVFWWSSRTIRAASMRRAVLKGTMTEADAEKTLSNVPDEYMVLVQGTNMQIFQHRGEEAFEKAAYLQLKKTKEKVYPTKVAFLKSARWRRKWRCFLLLEEGCQRRTDHRSGREGNRLLSPNGRGQAITYFDPRKMVDSKGEDL